MLSNAFPIIIPTSAPLLVNTSIGGSFSQPFGLNISDVSIPFINNHKQNDNSPIKIGIATYENMGFANPLESSIVKLFIMYPIPEML